MTLILGYDAAFPPANPYPNADVAAGYIGGNAFHVWTLDEWLTAQKLYQLPIWVGAGESDPVGHAKQCNTALQNLGFSNTAKGANRRYVVLDYETQIDPSWVDSFSKIVWAGGYGTLVYGSASTVGSDPPEEGRWVALYNGVGNLITGVSDSIGHQFAANVNYDGTQIDLSVWDSSILSHCGQGPRK